MFLGWPYTIIVSHIKYLKTIVAWPLSCIRINQMTKFWKIVFLKLLVWLQDYLAEMLVGWRSQENAQALFISWNRWMPGSIRKGVQGKIFKIILFLGLHVWFPDNVSQMFLKWSSTKTVQSILIWWKYCHKRRSTYTYI